MAFCNILQNPAFPSSELFRKKLFHKNDMSINTTSMFCLYKKGQERTPKRTLSRELPPERVQARFSRVLHVVCACCAACIAILTLRSTSSMCLHLACCCTGLIQHCDQIETSLNVHFGPSSAGADTGPPVLWIDRQKLPCTWLSNKATHLGPLFVYLIFWSSGGSPLSYYPG